jgi:2-polyprenyl-6-hydroxyphenyl methylase/3-demethylubiquinone-9 3-methyltransferase
MTNTTAHDAAALDIAAQHAREVEDGIRFEFGRNWSSFLTILDDDRIARAELSLAEMLDVRDLKGKSFLDIGSGSGLFSLAARNLGASVTSIDFDSDSVACTSELKRRFHDGDPDWMVIQGSVLDDEHMSSLGEFDIVYSWGVLHHTGDMWKALCNAAGRVLDGGRLFVAIYNDTGSQSKRWHRIKATYCKLPRFLKTPFAVLVSFPEEVKRILSFTVQGKPFAYLAEWRNCRNSRGMNRWHDIIDWVGGFPYEYAGPSKLFTFFRDRGFRLVNMKCDNVGLGCNEMVFEKETGGKVARID